MTMLNDLYLPDKKRLCTLIVGRAGSGKSYFLKHSIRDYLKRNTDKNHRLVFVCPKMEMQLYDDKPPITVDEMEKHLRKNRTACIWTDPSMMEAEIDYVIEQIFAIRSANPKFTCTLVIDDCQLVVDSRGSGTKRQLEFRRLALTGRSKGIRFVGVSHQLVFSKEIEGQTSYLVMFSMPFKLAQTDAKKRYGFDPAGFSETMQEKPYSFVIYDITTSGTRLMNPLEVKEGSRAEPKLRQA